MNREDSRIKKTTTTDRTFGIQLSWVFFYRSNLWSCRKIGVLGSKLTSRHLQRPGPRCWQRGQCRAGRGRQEDRGQAGQGDQRQLQNNNWSSPRNHDTGMLEQKTVTTRLMDTRLLETSGYYLVSAIWIVKLIWYRRHHLITDNFLALLKSSDLQTK